MNLKRWFAWLCLALMLVAEIFLFQANHAKEAALNSLRDAQQENHQLSAALEELKNSNTGLQAAEILRLRKQNEILTNRLAAVQAAADQLRAESQQAAQHLTTARTALQLQQEHLAQLQTENQQIANAQAEAQQRNACINNLRQIDGAKQQWALENKMATTDTPVTTDLVGTDKYLKVAPSCPANGSYTFNNCSTWPTCTLSDHTLN